LAQPVLRVVERQPARRTHKNHETSHDPKMDLAMRGVDGILTPQSTLVTESSHDGSARPRSATGRVAQDPARDTTGPTAGLGFSWLSRAPRDALPNGETQQSWPPWLDREGVVLAKATGVLPQRTTSTSEPRLRADALGQVSEQIHRERRGSVPGG
jgi:hypothetical protein